MGSVGVYGTEWRLLTVGGEAVGEMTEAEVAGERVGDVGDVGDVATCAQAALVSGKMLPAFVQEFLPSLLPSRSCVEEVRGLVLAVWVLAITDRGGRMVKILSSSGGGPYESNGSGTACSMGSIIGSDLYVAQYGVNALDEREYSRF